MDKKKSLRVEDRKTGIEEVLADLEREKTPSEQTCAWWLDISKKNWSSFFRQIFSWTKEYSICGIFGWLRDKQGIESKCDPISCWVAQSMTDLRNLTKNFNLRRTNQPISSNIQYHPISSWVAQSMKELRILESYKNPNQSTIQYLISNNYFQEKNILNWSKISIFFRVNNCLDV